jgi:apolipoprotein N-acyltransferase
MKLFKRTPKTPEEKSKLWNDRKYLMLSGVLFALGFSPIPLPITLFFALIPFLKVIETRHTLAEVNRASFLMSFTASIFALYWVGGYTEGKDPFLMIGGLLLFFINTIAFLIPTTLYYIVRKNFKSTFALLLFPFFWVFYEYLYTLTDWSFPWLNIGNGMSNFTAYIQIARIIGSYGVSLFVVAINVFLFLIYRDVREKKKLSASYSLTTILLIIVPLIYGVITLSSFREKSRSIKVGVVQPNLDPYDKWAGDSLDPIFQSYIDASQELYKQKIDLLIWPETALPVYIIEPVYEPYWSAIRKMTDSSGVSLLTGMPDLRIFKPTDKKPHDVKHSHVTGVYYATYNAIYLLNPNTESLQRYGKIKLVPFGERVPFVDQIPMLGDLMRWGVGLSGWNVGEEMTVFNTQMPGRKDSVKVGGVVCYESIYPDQVAKLASLGAQLLVVVTNDSWYGNTSGPYQHRDYAKMRAIENGRYVIRAANGGISCVIDPCGRIVSQTKMYEKTTYTGEVYASGITTFYTNHPHMITTLCTLVGLLVLALGLYKKIAGMISKKSASA